MDLEHLLDRSRALERRASALYRRFAAAARRHPEVCALWTRMAREEEGHADVLDEVRADVRLRGSSRTSLQGWDEAIAEVEERLLMAERLGAGATTAQHLAAALDLEMTELDGLRLALIAAAKTAARAEQTAHAEYLADAAERLTDDPQVRLQVALVRARARMQRV